MASKIYCSSSVGELEVWSEKLHKLSEDIGRIPSVDKYKLLPQIEALHIILTELDDRLCDLLHSCDSVETLDSRELKSGRRGGEKFADSSSEGFDYDFGG